MSSSKQPRAYAKNRSKRKKGSANIGASDNVETPEDPAIEAAEIPDEHHFELRPLGGREAFEEVLENIRTAYTTRDVTRENELLNVLQIEPDSDASINIIRKTAYSKLAEGEPTLFYDITMESDQGNTITLRYRRYDFYLVGIKIKDKWYEFKVEGDVGEMIPGSEKLHLLASYKDKRKTAKSDIAITPYKLNSWIDTLNLSPPETFKPKIGGYLDGICMLTSESIRFRRISEFFAHCMDLKNTTEIRFRDSGDAIHLIENWAYHSKALLYITGNDAAAIKEIIKARKELFVAHV